MQGVHWMELLSNCAGGVLVENERKRLEAVWELFQSETVFLIDHLMVLKHVRISPIISASIWHHVYVMLPYVMCCRSRGAGPSRGRRESFPWAS